MAPADELRAAADLVERMAAEATPGPWSGYVQSDVPRAEVFAGPWEDGYLTGCAFSWDEEAVTEYGGLPSAGDVAWLSLMGPQVAPFLAAWLRAEAKQSSPNYWHALAFAREIVGTNGPSAVVVIG